MVGVAWFSSKRRVAPVANSVRITREAKSERPAVSGVTASAASEDLSPRGLTDCCSFSCGVVESPGPDEELSLCPLATDSATSEIRATTPSSLESGSRKNCGMRIAECGLRKTEGRKQKAVGSKDKAAVTAFCLVPSAFCSSFRNRTIPAPT